MLIRTKEAVAKRKGMVVEDIHDVSNDGKKKRRMREK